MKRAVIVGASSGIGRALAIYLSGKGFELGLMARRINLLQELQSELPAKSIIKPVDIARTDEAIMMMENILAELKTVDLIIINAGVGWTNPDLEWEKEKTTIDVNVSGFTAMANVAYKYFSGRKTGHLVSVSSIVGLRGSRHAPAYNASKSYISNYMDGLRNKAVHSKLHIYFTDIRPGFVDTKMAQGDHVFWSASTVKAAEQIFNAIKRKKKRAYITRRWKFIAFLMKHLPDFIYNRT